MPFLIPLLPIIAGIGSVAGAGVGAAEAIQSGGAQRKAISQQEQIAQQEMADRQKIFDQLQPFFQQYLGPGSPFLSQMQRASAEQNAKQFSNAAGQLRNTMQTSGLGFGPSGATAAGIGGLGAQAAATSSGDYLTNLLNNENLKFQAAKGLQDVGAMAGAGQNQPNVSTQMPYTSPGSSIMGLAQSLQNLLKGSGGGGVNMSSPTNIATANLPFPNVPVTTPPFIGMPSTSGAPTTGGSWGFGP